jgi:Fic family protein
MLYEYALQASRLSTGLSFNTQGDQLEAQLDLMVQEAINTSRIEGEPLNQQDVRASLRNYLGLSTPAIRVSDSRAEGIAAQKAFCTNPLILDSGANLVTRCK